MLIFSFCTKLPKFKESVPKLTVIVGVTGVGAGAGVFIVDFELEEEVGVELLDDWVLLEVDDELLVWLDDWLALGTESVGLLLVDDEDEEVADPLLVSGVGLLFAVDELEVGEEAVWPTDCGLLVELELLAVDEVLVGLEVLLAELVLGVELGLVLSGVWPVGWLLLAEEELVELADCEVVGLTLLGLLALELAVWLVGLTWLVVLLVFAEVLPLLVVVDDFTLFVVVLAVVLLFASLLEVLWVLTELLVLALLSLVVVEVVWLAGALAVEPDDPQETTHAGIIHPIAAIPSTPPKIFQIFFFIQ